jgi:hypothetical protein
MTTTVAFTTLGGLVCGEPPLQRQRAGQRQGALGR